MRSFSTVGAVPILTAVLLWLGLPGGGEMWPLLFVALIPFLYVLTQVKPGQRFFLGLFAGTCHFILLLYWIVIVLGRYGNLPLAITVPALLLLALYMATYIACFAVAAGKVLESGNALLALFFLPALWVGLDWLRSFLFSGFPWMDLGYGLWSVPILIQCADLLGHYGSTFAIVLINCFFVLVFSSRRRGEKAQVLLASLLFAASVVMYGQVRLQQYQTLLDTAPTSRIGVVQGNIDQSKKWSAENQKHTVETYLSQTRSLMSQPKPPQLVVWPETALPFFPTRSPFLGDLQHFVKENNLSLLTGSPWFEEKEGVGGELQTSFYNSAFLLLSDGNRGDIYFKSHLVPFGEYVPLKKYLFFIAPLVEAVGDFTIGKVEKPLVNGTIKSGVLICFESIFPEIARDWVNAGANVLINVTNDAWYGKSSAPAQSMAMTVFRAVETRRSLVRAANTGISGFVDPLGRVTSSSDIFVLWAKSMDVSLINQVSFNSRYGYLFAPLCFVISLLVVLVRRRQN